MKRGNAAFEAVPTTNTAGWCLTRILLSPARTSLTANGLTNHGLFAPTRNACDKLRRNDDGGKEKGPLFLGRRPLGSSGQGWYGPNREEINNQAPGSLRNIPTVALGDLTGFDLVATVPCIEATSRCAELADQNQTSGYYDECLLLFELLGRRQFLSLCHSIPPREVAFRLSGGGAIPTPNGVPGCRGYRGG